MVGDGREQFLFVLSVERRLTHQHLVQKDPERPPVHALAVRLVVNNLRKQAKMHVIITFQLNNVEFRNHASTMSKDVTAILEFYAIKGRGGCVTLSYL